MFNLKKRQQKRGQKDQTRGRSLLSFIDPQSVNSEQFRTLRTNLEFAKVDGSLNSLLISSSVASEGKSTIAANLAYVMGQTEKRVLIVDADLRKPTAHMTFRIGNKQGLSTLISNPETRLDEVIQRVGSLNIDVLPSGPIPPNPLEMLNSPRMSEIIHLLAQEYGLVIYDAPPLTAVSDAQILAAQVDGVVLVIKYGSTKKREFKKAKESLNIVNANLIGFVMNGQPQSDTDSYYGYGYIQR